MEEQAELLEKLAATEHEQWCHWMKAMLGRTTLDFESRGYKIVFSAVEVAEYLRLIGAPYADLTNGEKDMDRVWARKAMMVFEEGM